MHVVTMHRGESRQAAKRGGAAAASGLAVVGERRRGEERRGEEGPTWLTAGGISAPSMISFMYSTSKFDSPIVRVSPSFTAFSIPRQVARLAAAPAGPLLQLL